MHLRRRYVADKKVCGICCCQNLPPRLVLRQLHVSSASAPSNPPDMCICMIDLSPRTASCKFLAFFEISCTFQGMVQVWYLEFLELKDSVRRVFGSHGSREKESFRQTNPRDQNRPGRQCFFGSTDGTTPQAKKLKTTLTVEDAKAPVSIAQIAGLCRHVLNRA